jgi:hypothetical protein
MEQDWVSKEGYSIFLFLLEKITKSSLISDDSY